MLASSTEFNSTALLLAAFGVLMLTCALLGRAVERIGVPVVFLFLGIGMLAGSEGIGGIPFDDYRLAFQLGTAALVLILVDAGFNTSLQGVRDSLLPAVVLATVGVAATACLVALFSRSLGMAWGEACLLGAVVSSTDAAAVFAVLRGGGHRLNSRVAGTIELESGINDPMSVILTVTTTAVTMNQAPSLARVAIDVPLQLAIGLAIGLAAGYTARLLLANVRLPTVGLYPVLTLGLGLLSFGAATIAHGSGFLAVFAAAAVLGNGPLPYRSGLSRIHDALGWISQVGMFLMLGLLVFPSQLLPVAWNGCLIALFLAVIARPVAVVLCLAPFRFPPREIAYVGWVGLRGAVPIILATIPVLAGVPGAMKVFNLVFFVVVMSALLPGVTIRWLARRLQLEVPAAALPPAVLEINSTRLLNGDLVSFLITESLAVCNAALSEIPFPPESAATLVVRGGQLVAARGSTVLLPGDHVYVFCRPHDRLFIELLFGRPQQE